MYILIAQCKITNYILNLQIIHIQKHHAFVQMWFDLPSAWCFCYSLVGI